MNFKKSAGIFFSFCFILSSTTLNSCSSSRESTHGYQLPNKEDFEGYQIIDGVDKYTITQDVSKTEKFAVVVRDISTTSYSYLEPRYMNSMTTYEGKTNCCRPEGALLGNSGLLVYKFSFIGKGETTVKLIARQKGLSVTAKEFESDKPFIMNFKVK